MNIITYLQRQLTNINKIFEATAGDLTDEEWVTRPAHGENTIGYTVWHIPRTQDTHVQTWIRGIPEVVRGDRWAHWQPLRHYGNGVGILLVEADEIARTVQRSDVIAYANAVHHEVLAWLGKLNESDLDEIPDIRGHLSVFSEYQTPGYIEEATDLLDQPVWSQLMRPCIGHVHRHLGELEIVKSILRKRK
jgi:DinB family protein